MPTQPTHPRAFKNVYVVSDLHIGGPRERQLFALTDALVALITEATEKAETAPTAFVLAGDIFDFLCEDYALYFDPMGAPARVARIARDPAFAPIFGALGSLLRAEQAQLFVLIGNHDIELALPDTQEALLRAFRVTDSKLPPKVSFLIEKIELQVNKKDVLIVHGNRCDDWNVVDHAALEEVANAQKDGSALPLFGVNGGTRLVIDVINQLKKTYPFVDLLKPEKEAVATVLLSVADVVGLAKLVPAYFHASQQQRADRERMRVGILSAYPTPLMADSPSTSSAPREIDLSLPELWRKVELTRGAGLTPIQLVPLGNATLDFKDALKASLFGASPREALRQGLKSFCGDETFEIGTKDGDFEKMHKKYPKVDFLIAGHTHLARSIKREGDGQYFNTGTWMKLIRLQRAWLEPENYGFFADRLLAPTLAKLEAPFSLRSGEEQSIVLKRPTYVLIEAVENGASGRLLERMPENDWRDFQELVPKEKS